MLEPKIGIRERIGQRARELRVETRALWLAARHPRTPWYAKALAFAVVAYALSPVDLIPDFVPVLGYLDDLVLLPAGIYLARRLVPADVLAECRASTTRDLGDGRGAAGRWAVGAVVGVWLVAGAWLTMWAIRAIR